MEQKSNGGFKVNKSISQLVGEITSLAVIITTNTDTDVFINYSAHCDDLEIRIHSDGWKTNSRPDIIEDVFTKSSKYRTEREVMKKLYETEKQLIKIARKGKIDFSKLPYELIEVKKYHLVGGQKNA